MSPARAPSRHPHDFGKKLARWLAENESERTEPTNPTALSRMLGVTHTAVNKWIQRGAKPRTTAVMLLAQLSGHRLEDWLNDSRPLPLVQRKDVLDSLLRMIPDDEAAALVMVLRDPSERKALIASFCARNGLPPPRHS